MNQPPLLGLAGYQTIRVPTPHAMRQRRFRAGEVVAMLTLQDRHAPDHAQRNVVAPVSACSRRSSIKGQAPEQRAGERARSVLHRGPDKACAGVIRDSGVA